MKPKNVFLLLASNLIELAKLPGKEIKKRYEINKVIRRVRNAPDLCTIFSRRHVVELIKFSMFVEEVRQAQEAVRQAVDHQSMDLQEQVDYFTELLRSNRRAPDASEEENYRTRNAESELDRWLDVLPPQQKGPSFLFVGPPDPQDALKGIASTVVDPGPPIHQRTVYLGEEGKQIIYTSTDSSGNTKMVTETYNAAGLFSRQIDQYDRMGRRTHEAREQLREVEGTQSRYEHRITSDHYHYSWRPAGTERWLPGLPPGNPRDWPMRGAPPREYFPREDGGGGTPPFFLKLPNGGYAMCYVISPVAGVSYCTLMSRDQVNNRGGYAPMIEASNMIIHPDDLVINPDPDNPLVRDLPTREEVERRFERPDPGPRDPMPDIT